MEKILVVDDDVLVLKTIQNVLIRKKFDVICAKSAHAATEILQKENVDLIISDIRMSEEDGITFIGRAKEYLLKNGQEVPFLFITGYASEEAPIQAMELGAAGYVLKPIDIDQLLSSINRALERGKERRSLIIEKKYYDIARLIEKFKKNRPNLLTTDEEVRVFIQSLEHEIQPPKDK